MEPDPGRSRGIARSWALAAGTLVLIAVAIIVVTRGGNSRPAASTQVTPVAPPHPPPARGGPPPVGPAAQPPPTPERFGASVNRLFNDRAYTRAQIDVQLHTLRQAGATVARSDALWEAAEPAAPVNGNHHFDWSFDDLIAGSLAANGLQWLPILDYSAPWARSVAGQDHSGPRSPSAFASFAAAFASRYGSGGTFWREHPGLKGLSVSTYEVWNEPDNKEFWVPVPNAAQYVDLYLSARNAITTVDPSARVIVGGLTNISAFLPAMLQARPDLAGHIDGVAIHPYGANPLIVLARIRGARSVLASLGMSSVPLYVTEFGWTTHPAGALDWAPARLRLSYIAATIEALGHLDCGVAAAILYTWVTPERNLADSQDWFGIHPPRGGSSPDSSAFAASLRTATQPAKTVELCGQ
jgi:polysaccharide biosynthesis protein PslG